MRTSDNIDLKVYLRQIEDCELQKPFMKGGMFSYKIVISFFSLSFTHLIKRIDLVYQRLN